MKKHYRVWVSEKYIKEVDVYADNPADIEDEVRDMEESGEIEWDRAEDFDEWGIIEYREEKLDALDEKEANGWLMGVVSGMSNKQLAEMTRLDCLELLGCMYDEGRYIPPAVTSADLWKLVQEYQNRKRM